MGAFNINITGVGGHGCERKAKAGEKLWARCGKWSCPDCIAYEFVQRLKQAGIVREGDTAYTVEMSRAEATTNPDDPYSTKPDCFVASTGVDAGKYYKAMPHEATFTHWPGQPSTVVDDMLKNERKSGAF